MGMLEESVGEWWESVRQWAWSLLKLVSVSAAGYLGLRWLGLDVQEARFGVTMALLFWGSVMYFVGPRVTGAGFWAGFRGSYTWVDTPTPASAWKFGGVVCWLAALACLVFMG